MKRQTRLSKVTIERDTYRSQVAASLRVVDRVVETGEALIAKAEELMAHKDAEIAMANAHIEKLHELLKTSPR
jgi:hypothetical protein